MSRRTIEMIEKDASDRVAAAERRADNLAERVEILSAALAEVKGQIEAVKRLLS